MSYENLIRKALNKGLSEIEIFTVESSILEFKVSNEKIVEPSRIKEIDIGIRGAIGRRVGSIRVNKRDLGDDLVDKLISVIRSSEEDPHWSGFPPPYRPLIYPRTFDDKAISMSDEEYADLLRHVMDKLKEPALSKGVDRAVVVEGAFRIVDSKITITNSNGLDAGERYSNVMIWLTLSLENKGASSDKSIGYARSALDTRELEKKALEEGERALLFFGSRPIESGSYDVVFNPDTAGAIIETVLAPAFSALNILENRSPLRGRLGQQVLSEKISIIDDPSLDYATGSRSIDHEGVSTSVKPVVEKGVFKTMLQSYYTARRMNTQPTGNGIRQAPPMNPTPGFTNIVVEPRSGSLEKYVGELDKGLVVYEVIGYWMSDPVSGGVKATVTHGLYVERGNVVKPVKGVVIGGNIYDMLSGNLVEVGKDAEILGNIIVPSIWIRDVKVAGE